MMPDRYLPYMDHNINCCRFLRRFLRKVWRNLYQMMTSHMIHTATQLINIALGFGVLRHVGSRLTVPIGVLVHVAAHLSNISIWSVIRVSSTLFGVLMHSVSHLTAPFGVSPPWTSRVIFCLGIKVKRSWKFY